MSKLVNIVAYGYYGAGNLGDELLLRILLNWTWELEARVTVLSFNPEHTKQHHNVDAVPITDLVNVIKAIQTCDLLILGGGGIFQTHQEFTISALYRFDGTDISLYARPILMAQQLAKPVLLWAQGIGPLDHKESEEIVKDIFTRAAHISLRDNQSALLLEKLGVHRKVIVAPDPVWTYPIAKTIKSRSDSQSLRLAIVLRMWRFSPDWNDRIVKALNANFPHEGCTLVWIPFQSGEMRDDHDLMEEIRARLDSPYVHEWCLSKDMEDQIQAISTCDCVIAMRMHAQILATKMGKPTLCIEYDEKMAIISREARIPDQYRLSINASDNQWLRAFDLIINHHKDAKANGAVQKLITQAIAHREMLQNAINSIAYASENITCEKWCGGSFHWIEAWLDDLSHQKSPTLEISNMFRIRSIVQANESKVTFLNMKILEQQKITSDLNTSLVESNKIISELHTSLTESNKIIASILQSESWKITSPLRSFGRITRTTMRGFRYYLKQLYWLAPANLRTRVKRAKILQVLKVTPELQDISKKHVDLSWEQFNTQVLAHKEQYRGVFIQEATIDWSTSLYQRPQHISAAMARRGYLVIYVTMNLSCDSVDGFRMISEGLWVTNSEKIHSLNNVIRSFYSTSYAHTPESLLKNGKRGILVYEYIDHIDPEISGDSFNIKRLQDLKDFAFSGGVDYVVASAKKLYDEAVNAIGKDRVVLVQNGVDVDHYLKPCTNKKLPSLLSDFRSQHKVLIGYFGALAPWLWYEAIAELVKMRQDLGFVFIGPDYYGGAERLPTSANTLRLDAVPYQALPGIGSSFDICFIPFKPGEIARTTSPLKLFEYFALQKPVVVTSDMLECIAYDEVFHGDSPSSLSIAIDKALAVIDKADYKTMLLDLAWENDWNVRAKDYENGLGLPVRS